MAMLNNQRVHFQSPSVDERRMNVSIWVVTQPGIDRINQWTLDAKIVIRSSEDHATPCNVRRVAGRLMSMIEVVHQHSVSVLPVDTARVPSHTWQKVSMPRRVYETQKLLPCLTQTKCLPANRTPALIETNSFWLRIGRSIRTNHYEPIVSPLSTIDTAAGLTPIFS